MRTRPALDLAFSVVVRVGGGGGGSLNVCGLGFRVRAYRV